MKKYELSLWQYDDLDMIAKERKIAVISSSEMSSQKGAYNIVLKSNINGTNTLTFNLLTHYNDPATSQLIRNDLEEKIIVESIIKLKKDDDWYDFVVTNKNEDPSGGFTSYTAKDLYIQELSKNGFNLEFNSELGNNLGTIQELAKQALETSEWKVDLENSDIIHSYAEDWLIGIKLKTSYNASKVLTTEQVFIPEGSWVYLYYNDFKGTTNVIQGFYSDKFQSSEKNIDETVYDNNYYAQDGIINQDLGQNIFVDRNMLNLETEFISQFKGERLVETNRVEFNSVLDRYVTKYEDDIYGFISTEFLTPDYVQEFIVNGNNFVNSAGWYSVNPTDPAPEYLIYSAGLTPSFIEGGASTELFNGLGFTSGIKYYNTCFRYNFSKIGAIKEKEYFLIDYQGVGDVNFGLLFQNSAGVWIDQPIELEKITEETFKLTFLRSYSEEQIKNLRLTLWYSVNDGGNGVLYKLSMYKPVKKIGAANEYEVYRPGDSVPSQTLEKNYFYYGREAKNWLKKEDYIFIQEGDYKPITNNYQKITSIEKKESNIFNIIQELCEKFKCWARFLIDHNEDGTIKENGKTVVFKKYLGDINYQGFKKGMNLKSIKRTVNSEQICTKTIVKPNKNQHGLNGFCTISRAKANPSGQNYILNFDYYVQKGLISKEELYEYLYYKWEHEIDSAPAQLYYKNEPQYLYRYKVSKDSQDYETTNKRPNILPEYYIAEWKINKPWAKWIRYYSKENGFYDIIKSKAEARDALVFAQTEEMANYLKGMTNLQLAKEQIEAGSQQLNNLLKDYKLYTGSDYPFFPYKFVNEEYGAQRGDSLLLNFSSIEEIKRGLELLSKFFTAILEGFFSVDAGEFGGFGYDKLSTLLQNLDPKVKEFVTQIGIAKKQILLAEQQQELYKDYTQEEYEYLKTFYKTCLNLISSSSTEKILFNKYKRYIKEGAWTSEDYFDDDLYYLAACDVARTSSKPKINYTIDVIDISQLEGYELIDFKVGDKTIIEDEDYFGYTTFLINEKVFYKPYQEEVIIIELTEHFDDPSKNKITLQNYKTQFDDLFQRIAAQTQQLQYASGGYNRASAAFNSNGVINKKVFEDSLTDSQDYLQEMVSEETTIKEEDAQLTSSNPTFFSGNSIVDGKINVDKVLIGDDNNPTFRWDRTGLVAYTVANNFVDKTKFVRFDQYGIYGYDGESETFLPNSKEEVKNNKDTIFGLTWDGFFLRSQHKDGGYIEIDRENDFRVITQDNNERMKIGLLNPEEDDISKYHYGIRLTNTAGEKTFETDANGSLTIKGTIYADNGRLGPLSIEVKEDNTKRLVYRDGGQAFIIDPAGFEEKYWEGLAIYDSSSSPPDDYNRTVFSIGGAQSNFAINGPGHVYIDSLSVRGFYIEDVLFYREGQEVVSIEKSVTVFNNSLNFRNNTVNNKGYVKIGHDDPTNSPGGYIALRYMNTSDNTLLIRQQGTNSDSKRTAFIGSGMDDDITKRAGMEITSTKANDKWSSSGNLIGEWEFKDNALNFKNTTCEGYIRIGHTDATYSPGGYIALRSKDDDNILLIRQSKVDDQSATRTAFIGSGLGSNRAGIEIISTKGEGDTWSSKGRFVGKWETIGTSTSTTQDYINTSITFSNDDAGTGGYLKIGHTDVTNSKAGYVLFYKKDGSNYDKAFIIKLNGDQPLIRAYADYIGVFEGSWEFKDNALNFKNTTGEGYIRIGHTDSTSSPGGYIALRYGSDTANTLLIRQQGTNSDSKRTAFIGSGMDDDITKRAGMEITSTKANDKWSSSGKLIGNWTLNNATISEASITKITSIATVQDTALNFKNTTGKGHIRIGHTDSTSSPGGYIALRYGDSSDNTLLIRQQDTNDDNIRTAFIGSGMGDDITKRAGIKIISTEAEGDWTSKVNIVGACKIDSLQVGSGGSCLEIYGTTPYIDFHHSESTEDYTSRIIEQTSGELTIQANLKINGGWKIGGWTYGSFVSGSTYSDCFYSKAANNDAGKSVLTMMRGAGLEGKVCFGVRDLTNAAWLAYINSNGNIACNNLQAQSGSLSASDYRKKNTINPLNTSYSTFFDKLRPVTYKYNNGTSDRLHTGFIAQDIQQALIDSGISTQDFAGFVTIPEQVVDPDTGEETMVDMHYLRYEEFIALNTSEIQKLKKRVAELEQQLQTLQNSN